MIIDVFFAKVANSNVIQRSILQQLPDVEPPEYIEQCWDFCPWIISHRNYRAVFPFDHLIQGIVLIQPPFKCIFISVTVRRTEVVADVHKLVPTALQRLLKVIKFVCNIWKANVFKTERQPTAVRQRDKSLQNVSQLPHLLLVLLPMYHEDVKVFCKQTSDADDMLTNAATHGPPQSITCTQQNVGMEVTL